MARRVDIGHDCVTVHLTGLTSVAALKRNIEIPYKHIVHVSTAAPDPTSLMRLGGTAIGDIQEGHFWHGEDWYFLSYEHPDKVICLTLTGYYIGDRLYKVVAVGVGNPQVMKREIEARIVGK
ncbi:hypothetical protein [Alicyclobacillus dauci]|uniref:Uncharacterized protein n=1 Tax=Alicyclobacillus dauci TaxID=1475485 RepID=A0ABY6Z3F4_9BACL|nr:hypothetical protein [Alicyclobacillus dauci]WAH37285.1 hypothetical protein NZD86_01685 [Alicyclobacillus dauci]